MPKSSVAEERVEESSPNAWTTLEEHVAAGVSAKMDAAESWSTDPEALRRALDEGVLKGLEHALQRQVERWADEVIGAGRYEHSGARRTYRSGVREHTVTFRVGKVTVRVPKPRQGSSRPSWLPALKRAPESVMLLVRQLWLRGLSTRDVSAVSEELTGRGWSHASVHQWTRDVADEVLRWLNRPVRDDVRFLVLDAVYVPVVRSSSKKEPVLVALGITATGHKEILGVQLASSESLDGWLTLLSRLKLRGLDAKKLELVITDGNEGLMSAVEDALPGVARQRCTVHKVRNVVGKSSRELKKTAPAKAAKIFKASSRAVARRRAEAFITEYEESAPHLAAIIRNDLDACLRFYDFDSDLWPTLRSTNALERTHRELRRKFREVGALKGEVNGTRIAVMVAKLVNADMADKPVGQRRRRAAARSAQR